MLVLRGHEDAVRCLSYSPDGRYLASGGEDSTVRLRDLAAGGILLATFQYSASIEALVFRPDGENLILGASNGTLLPWNHRRKRLGAHELAHPGGVRCMACTPDGETLITAGWDKTVKMWDPATLKQQFILQYGVSCTALAVTPDGTIIVTGNDDGTIIAMDRADTVKLAVRTEEQRLADDTFFCAPLAYAVKLARMEKPHPPFALAWSPDGRLLASGQADGTILLRERTGEYTSLPGHTWTVYSLAFTPDGHTLISGGADGTVRVWDVATLHEKRCFRWHESWVTCAAVAPDGMTAAAGSADHTIVVWDLDEA